MGQTDADDAIYLLHYAAADMTMDDMAAWLGGTIENASYSGQAQETRTNAHGQLEVKVLNTATGEYMWTPEGNGPESSPYRWTDDSHTTVEPNVASAPPVVPFVDVAELTAGYIGPNILDVLGDKYSLPLIGDYSDGTRNYAAPWLVPQLNMMGDGSTFVGSQVQVGAYKQQRDFQAGMAHIDRMRASTAGSIGYLIADAAGGSSYQKEMAYSLGGTIDGFGLGGALRPGGRVTLPGPARSGITVPLRRYEDDLYWPPNRGVIGGVPMPTVLPVGYRVDRYGAEGGNFLSPAGTLLGMRSLDPVGTSGRLHTYEVVRPLPAQYGVIAPYFGQQGGGKQFELPMSVHDAQRGPNPYLKRVKP